jgi:hypothetical protein
MKKLLIAAVIVVGAFFVFRKTNLASYVSTAWCKVKNGAKNQVPLEFEVDRVRNEIANLDGDVRSHLGPIAEEMATIKTLKNRIQVKRESLRNEKINLLAMARELEDGKKFITYGDEEFSADEIRAKLDREFAAYRRAEAELKSEEKLLAAKEKALRTVREQLANMKTLKRDLEIRLAQLEADLKTVRLAQTRDTYQMDDSRLAEIKASLADIEHRLEAERAVTELHGQFATDPVPVHKKTKSAGDLSRSVKNYFNENKEADDKVAVNK